MFDEQENNKYTKKPHFGSQKSRTGYCKFVKPFGEELALNKFTCYFSNLVRLFTSFTTIDSEKIEIPINLPYRIALVIQAELCRRRVIFVLRVQV